MILNFFRINQLLILALSGFAFYSCGHQEDCENKVDISQVHSKVQFVRLEKSLFDAKTAKDLQGLFIKYPKVASTFFGIDPNDSIAVNDLFRFYTIPSLKEFYKEGEKINNDFEGLNDEVQELFKHINYYFPSYNVPPIYTIVTGFQQGVPDIIVMDSIAGISIDYFYGSKCKFRPNEYNYMLKRREPYYIVPSLALRIAQEDFVEFNEKDKTMLAEMIKWGKAYYFMKRVMPCTPDSIIIGYTNEEIKDVENNMDLIWGYFIENKLFYQTSAEEVNRYVGESPKVAVIGERCPGRIGRYIGWQIVRAYMKRNPEVTVPMLMKEMDAQKIFRLSKYKPKKK